MWDAEKFGGIESHEVVGYHLGREVPALKTPSGGDTHSTGHGVPLLSTLRSDATLCMNQ